MISTENIRCVYGYEVGEITSAAQPNLDLDIDPKLSWALRNRSFFPVDVNKAAQEILFRVPGLGVRNAKRITAIRRHGAIRVADLIQIRVNLKKCLPFIAPVASKQTQSEALTGEF